MSVPNISKAGSSKAKTKADPLQSLKTLESTAIASPYNPNPLLPLLTYSRHSSAEVVHKAIWALHRIFVQYIEENRVGGLSHGRGESAEDNDLRVNDPGQVKGWVRERLLDYVDVLGGLLRDTEPALRESALPLLFSLLPPLSATVSGDKPIIHTAYFRLILQALFKPTPSLRGAKPAPRGETSDEGSGKWEIEVDNQVEEEGGVLPADVIEKVQEEFWAKYDDLRWAFFKESTYIIQNERLGHSENLLGQLLSLTNLPRVQDDLNTFFLPSMSEPPSSTVAKGKANGGKKKKRKVEKEVDALPDWMATYESESETEEPTTGRKRVRLGQMSIHAAIHSVQSHTIYYTTLWEAVLSSMRLDDSQTRRVLVGLHGEKGILGHMREDRRVRVADWLGGLVDLGGAKAMLAMNGLFVLMTKYNLDYPDFYKRLYGLLNRNVLHVKYRARFFRLLDTFLSSALLPAALVASFIKRLSRLALTAPPAGTIIVIPFVYNLFKRHPGCMVMIQRHGDGAQVDEAGQYQDPYLENDPSPLTSNAINSSCWELASLQKHYLAAVSTLAKVFMEVFTRPEYNMEDFLDHGYDTLFTTESNRKIKNPPALSLTIESGGDIELFPKRKEADEMVAGEDEVSRLWSF